METSSSRCTGSPTSLFGSWSACRWFPVSITSLHSGRRLTGAFPNAAAAHLFSAGATSRNRLRDGQMLMSLLQPNSSSAVAPVQEFSSEERAQLLRLAHDSIASALHHREISLHPPTPHLADA